LPRRKMLRALAVATLLASACATGGDDDAPSPPTPGSSTPDAGSQQALVVAPCRVGGCSSQLCATEELVSTCEWRPEYACYRDARCEPQPGGACGWTQTPELLACLEAARAATP
jgi:hypothetical protein